MEKVYLRMFNVVSNTKKIKYPSRFRNFTNGYYPPLFIKQDHNFFTNEYFKITHQYYEPMLEVNKLKDILFNKKHIQVETHINWNCELITTEHACFGKLYIHKNLLIFQSEKEVNDPRNNPSTEINFLFSSLKTDIIYKNNSKQIIIFYSEIEEILIRRFLLMNQAIEIYLKNGKSYFFNLFKTSFLSQLISNLPLHNKNNVIIDYSSKEFNVNLIIKAWYKSELSSFDFLLLLNKYATRTFRDVNQYPIFPWMLYSYDDLFKAKVTDYRNLKYPIAIQTEEKRIEIQAKYQESSSCSKFGTHFGCHYSTGPFIYYYMMRLTPFTQSMIKLQNKELESSNRMFISFDDTLKILCKTDDNRELIPQFYSMIEMFINLNCIDLKKRKKNLELIQVDDFEMNSHNVKLDVFVDFIYRHIRLLNSKTIKKNLPKWIDYIFGVNQLTKKEELCNTFPRYAYAQLFNLEKKFESVKNKFQMNEKKIIQSMKDKIQMIINFGQTPAQVLKEALIKYQSGENDDEYENLGSNINSKKLFRLEKDIIYYVLDMKRERLFFAKKKSIEIYETTLMKKKKTIKIKAYSTLQKFKKNNHPSISPYKPQYAMISLKQYTVYIICRYLDHTFKLINESNDLIEIFCEEFVSAVAKIDEEHFFTGLSNGKLIEWELLDKLKCNQRRHLFAHDSSICAIHISHKHKVIITSGEERTIYIRKLYDFELLSVIHSDPGYIGVDIKISILNFVYIMYYIPNENCFILTGYTLNALQFASSRKECYSHFDCSQTGNIIVSYHNESKIKVLSASTLEELDKSITPSNNEIITWFDYDITKDRLSFSLKNGELERIPLN